MERNENFCLQIGCLTLPAQVEKMLIYKMSRLFYLKKIPLLPKIFGRISRFMYSCEIPYTAKIDKSVFFAHKGLGVVIGHDAIVGPNTRISHNVTIGGRSEVRANPVIGKNVIIGAGACVLGKIKVGDNSIIGANSVVIKDVDANSTVAGVPAKYIRYVPKD